MIQADNTVCGDVANWGASSSVGRWWFQSTIKAAMNKAHALRTARGRNSDDRLMVLGFPKRADEIDKTFKSEKLLTENMG